MTGTALNRGSESLTLDVTHCTLTIERRDPAADREEPENVESRFLWSEFDCHREGDVTS